MRSRLADGTDAAVGGEGGGSMPVKTVRVPIAFDTPDLVLTGIPIYTPAAGDLVVYASGFISTGEGWTGTVNGGILHFGYAGSLTAYDGFFTVPDLSQADDTDYEHAYRPGVSYQPGNYPFVFVDDEPLTAMVDDGSGGDPGLLSGTGEIVLLVASAP